MPPVITGEELSRAMAEELGKIPESESARRAFNTLAGFWKAPPLSEGDLVNPSDRLERAALGRKLLPYRFSGNLGTLLRLGHPAALELTLPDAGGKRFIVVTGMDHEHLLIDPPIAGKNSFSFSEMERHWAGEGFLFWRDPLNLLSAGPSESRTEPVKRLQELLKETGSYTGPLTGIYDGDTRSAIKAFQASRGIEADGIAGAQTLMLLYGSINRFDVPTLSAGQK